MTDQTSREAVSDRKAAEQEYSVTAFDYVRNPVGSRDWTLYWDGWQACWSRAAKPAVPESSHELTLVLHKGKPQSAYPRRKQAEVYASGYSSSVDIELVDGTFSANRLSAAPPLPVAQGVEPDREIRLTPKQCAEQFRMYAGSERTPKTTALRFCADFLDQYCAAPTPPAAPKEPPSLATLIERANATLGEFEVPGAPKEPT